MFLCELINTSANVVVGIKLNAKKGPICLNVLLFHAYKYTKGKPNNHPPPIQFPIADGIILSTMYSLVVTGAPYIMPNGTRPIFAITWS
jgi:hypothetical protein